MSDASDVSEASEALDAFEAPVTPVADIAPAPLALPTDRTTHASRRKAAAMAAQASQMVPINSRSTRKRTDGQSEARGSTSSNSTGQAKISKAPSKKPPPPVPDADGNVPMLQSHQTTDADEMYGDQEKALSEFLKLHPMLSVNQP